MLFSNDEQIKNSSFWRDLENSTFFLPLNLINESYHTKHCLFARDTQIK